MGGLLLMPVSSFTWRITAAATAATAATAVAAAAAAIFHFFM